MFVPFLAALFGWMVAKSVSSSPSPSNPHMAAPGYSALTSASGIYSTDPAHSPSGPSRTPSAGVQSYPDHHWSYTVRSANESAGSIAEMILGADQAWRYVELLVANPQKPVRGSRVVPEGSDDELNFVSLAVGEKLRLPRSWNGWIDEVGNPRGRSEPWPAPKGGV